MGGGPPESWGDLFVAILFITILMAFVLVPLVYFIT